MNLLDNVLIFLNSFLSRRVSLESCKKKDPGNYKPVSLTLTPGKVVEKTILKALSKHMMDKVGVISIDL